MRASEIAKRLGLSREAIRIHLKKNKLPTNLYKPQVCKDCGINISPKSARCKNCAALSHRIEVKCSTCNKNFSILKSQYNRSTTSPRYKGKFYHDRKCFYNRIYE